MHHEGIKPLYNSQAQVYLQVVGRLWHLRAPRRSELRMRSDMPPDGVYIVAVGDPPVVFSQRYGVSGFQGKFLAARKSLLH